MAMIPELQRGMSKSDVIRLAELAAGDKKLLSLLLDSITEEGLTGMKSSWIISTGTVMHKGFLKKETDRIIEVLPHIETMGTKRELIKALMFSDVLDSGQLGLLTDTLLHFLRSGQQDISVRYNSMKLLEMICNRYPDLYPEFLDTLHAIQPGVSQTFRKYSALIRKRYEKKSGSR